MFGGDRFAGNSQLAINNCKVLTLTGHGPGLFAVGKKRQWNDRPRLADDYNWTRLLPYCKNFAGHGVTACLGRKNLGKTGLILGPDNIWIMSRESKVQGIRQRTSCETLFELLSHLWYNTQYKDYLVVYLTIVTRANLLRIGSASMIPQSHVRRFRRLVVVHNRDLKCLPSYLMLKGKVWQFSVFLGWACVGNTLNFGGHFFPKTRAVLHAFLK